MSMSRFYCHVCNTMKDDDGICGCTKLLKAGTVEDHVTAKPIVGKDMPVRRSTALMFKYNDHQSISFDTNADGDLVITAYGVDSEIYIETTLGFEQREWLRLYLQKHG